MTARRKPAAKRSRSGSQRSHAEWKALGYTRVAVWLDAAHLAILDRLAAELDGRRDAIEAMLEAAKKDHE